MTSKNQYTMPFVHLRVHSAYSLGVGSSAPRDLCAQAAQMGFSSLALTDTDGTYGFVEFHRAARDFGIKPIYGASLSMDWDQPAGNKNGNSYGLVLLALDRSGLKNLCALASVAASRKLLGQSLGTTDLEGRADGLVCLLRTSGIMDPETDSDGARDRALLTRFKSLWGERVFVEIQAGDRGGSADWLNAAGELDIQPVLTSEIRFAGQKQYRLGAAVKSREDEKEMPGGGPEEGFEDRYRMKAEAEMFRFYSADPEAYTNASMIASLVQPDLLDTLDRAVPGHVDLTKLETDSSPRITLANRAREEFEERYPRNGSLDPAERKRYLFILDEELAAVDDDDLADTFLIFSEIMSRLRQVDVCVGPATGLRLQSLCAFLLGITCIDPYKVDPHFLPDFDTGLKRYRILDLQVAGNDRPKTVTTLNKIFDGYGLGYVPAVDHVTPARALRIAAQGMSIEDEEYREVLRIAADQTGVSLKDLCEENRAIGHLYKKSAAVRELLTRAAAVEGLPCGFIRSKRTLIVSPRPLREFLGYTINPETGELFYQATREAFPTKSIYRIDITTLTALSVTAEADEHVDEPLRSRSDWGKELFDFPEVFRHIADGDQAGVYLLDAPVTQRLAASFEPGSFNELTNFLALMRYRHSEMSFTGRVEAFKSATAKTEAGESSVSFLLNDTKGWLLYEDQLREILTVLTGLVGSDVTGLLRRFRKHEPGNLADLRGDFMGYAVEAELPLEEAKYWFNRIMFYVGKTLRRQRVIADALIVGRLLWYKHKYRGAFFAALLNAYKGNDAKSMGYLGIAEAEGLLLTPHVNHSGRHYVYENGLIRAPLSRVEGLSETAIRGILRERRNGKFTDSDDLVCRLGGECINNKEVETLVRERAVEPGEAVIPRIEAPITGRGPEPQQQRVTKRNDVPQLELVFHSEPTEEVGSAAESPGASPPIKVPSTKKDGNKRENYRVVPSLKEFYPHPTASPVELAGRVRNLHVVETSSGIKTRFFVLFDAKSSVRVFQPAERIGQSGEPLADGSHVLVRGLVSVRDGKKVCDALDVIAVEGGAYSDGETTPDQSAEGDP